MRAAGIDAYDNPTRIAGYDADMDVMHPNRHRMADVVTTILPFAPGDPIRVLDLGVGTGFLALRVLERFPQATVIAIDGASSMIEVASARLESFLDRVEFRVADFREYDDTLRNGESAHLIVSAYALHHLDATGKENVLRRAVEFLEPGGWLLNADIIVGSSPHIETRYQQLRAEGIVERAQPDDDRFRDLDTTNAFLRNLEETEGDQPIPVERDLALLRRVGLDHVNAFWVEFREAVTGGIRPPA